MDVGYHPILYKGGALGTITLYCAETGRAKQCSRSFVRGVLGTHLDINGLCLAIDTDRYGKPYLPDWPGVHFNVSHTKGFIACAVADRPIGVDVERLRRFEPAVAENFFAEQEKKYVFSTIKDLRGRFLEVWTKKEAFVKWQGKGMEIAFAAFDVFALDEEIMFHTFWHGPYCITVCGKRKEIDGKY